MSYAKNIMEYETKGEICDFQLVIVVTKRQFKVENKMENGTKSVTCISKYRMDYETMVVTCISVWLVGDVVKRMKA